MREQVRSAERPSEPQASDLTALLAMFTSPMPNDRENPEEQNRTQYKP